MFDADPTNLTPPAPRDFPAGFRVAASIQMQDFVLFGAGPVFYEIRRAEHDASQPIRARLSRHLRLDRMVGRRQRRDQGSFQGSPMRLDRRRLCAHLRYDRSRGISRQCIGRIRIGAIAEVGGKPSRQVATLVARHAPAAGPTAFAASAAVSVAGHSLGSALATLYVMENAKTEQLAESARLHFRFAACGRRIVRRSVQRTRAHFVAGRQRAGSRAEPAPGIARIHPRGYALPGYLDGEGEVFARVLARVGDPPEPDRSSATTECGLPPGAAGGCCACRGGANENRALRRKADRRGKPHDAQVDKGRTGHDQLDDRRRRRSVISPAESCTAENWRNPCGNRLIHL